MVLQASANSPLFFFFNAPATTEIYTLSLHDALPIWSLATDRSPVSARLPRTEPSTSTVRVVAVLVDRSEEHTSELQSRRDLVCRLLLEKKKNSHAARLACLSR